MIDFHVVRLRRTRSDGSLIEGKWRGQTWIQGETVFSNYNDARVVRGRVGGDILPFKESRLYQLVEKDVRDAIEKVEELTLSGSFDDSVDEDDLSPLFNVPATKDE